MATMPAPVAAPSPDEIRRIVAIPDPVLRNLEITYCYHRLSLAFTARTGECANWCTFATWASKQAGRTIRGEDWIDALTQNTLTGSALRHPIRALWRVLLLKGLLRRQTLLGRITNAIHSPFDALERASDAVARGNLKVFEEIGFEFARYLQSGASDLRPGPPPDGQDYLTAAFARYNRQASEADASVRAQLIFFANLEIGFHEQTRLQPEIQESLESVPETLRSLGFKVREAISRPARKMIRRLITRSLMTLAFPDTTLALGTHLDRIPAASLAQISDAELQVLLARFEPGKAPLDDAGAEDWASLEQRMHFIVHLFRGFHDCRELLDPPFTPEQVEALRRGVIPRGRL